MKYIERKRYEKAQIELLNALEVRPADFETNLQLARVFLKQGSLPQALAAYRKALEIRSDYRDTGLEYSRLVCLLCSCTAADSSCIDIFKKA